LSVLFVLFVIACAECCPSRVVLCFSFGFFFILSISGLGYVPLVANTSRSFPHSRLITGFITRLTRRVPLVEQELLTLPEHLSSPLVFSGVRVRHVTVKRHEHHLIWKLCWTPVIVNKYKYHEPFTKQMGVKTTRTSFLRGNRSRLHNTDGDKCVWFE
jgi:hypothetical protein